MRVAAVLASIGAMAMAATLVYGFTAGGGWAEVRVLLDYPWFVVSLIDVYIGFSLVAGWMIYREAWPVALLWIVLLMTLGNLIACLYVLVCLARSGGSWPAFWLGARQARHA
jgi:hypothetical protein